jgi:hypothetical protein
MANAEYASDGTTLVEVINRFELEGYDGQFAAVEGGLRCFGCGGVADGSVYDLGLLRRTEGASDPADMVAVAGVTCPACGAKGTVALKYGPEASAEESDVLGTLEGKAGPATPPA